MDLGELLTMDRPRTAVRPSSGTPLFDQANRDVELNAPVVLSPIVKAAAHQANLAILATGQERTDLDRYATRALCYLVRPERDAFPCLRQAGAVVAHLRRPVDVYARPEVSPAPSAQASGQAVTRFPT
jgi:hypothetical protein